MSTLRSDVIGSLLRPPYLKEARSKRETNELTDAEFATVGGDALAGALAQDRGRSNPPRAPQLGQGIFERKERRRCVGGLVKKRGGAQQLGTSIECGAEGFFPSRADVQGVEI